MRRMAIAILELLVSTILGIVISVWLSSTTPVIQNTSVLPKDVCTRAYSISGIEELTTENGFMLRFRVESDLSECSLVVKNLVPYDIKKESAFSVYQNDALVFELANNIPYSRIQTIPLNAVLPGESLQICFASDALQKPLMRRPHLLSVILGFAPSQPQIMIVGNAYQEKLQHMSWLLNAGVLGVYLALIVYSLSLWIKARSQRYLMLIFSSSILALISTELVYFSTGLNLSYNQYTFLFQMLSCLTSILSGTICIFLHHDVWINRRPLIRDIPLAIGVFVVAFAVSIAFSIRLYVFLRRVLWIPVLITFYKAIRRNEYGAKILACSYVFTETILFLMYISNEWPPATSDVIKMHFRFTDIMHLLFLLCCTVIINNRFGSRYTEERVLSLELGELVKERTQSLIEAQEQRHNIMLNIFHDLRSPLFVFHHRLYALSAHNDDETRSLCVMKERLAYMEQLTEDLFLVFKLENNEVIFDFDDCDLDGILREIISSGSPQAIERRISILYTGMPARIWGDYLRLKQAFQNLIDNAVQYSKEGERVHILLEHEDQYAVVKITDNGIGIPQEDIKKVFHRYYRCDAKNPNSSGLGLSIVKEIVKAHRGTIDVKSEESRGTMFTVRFPILQEQEYGNHK